MNNKPDYHTLNDSVMSSIKHLDSIKGYEGYITSEQWRTPNTSYIRYNPLTGGYEWANSHVKPIPHYPHPTDLWQAMFGKPSHDVWNRFARAFHYWAPEFIKLGRRLNTIHSYWVMDWLTNVFTPRINQYDPVNYVKYCKDHLNYDITPNTLWRRNLNMWPSSVYAAIFNNGVTGRRFAIDDVCKQTLAQMFPVKFLVNKRII